MKKLEDYVIIQKLESKFNMVLNYINSSEIIETDRKKIENLTNKMLKYSFPFNKDDGEEMISIHFYTSELIDFIYIYLNNFIYSRTLEVDYYSKVLELKEEYKKSKQEAK